MKAKGIISTNQYVWLLFSVITSFTVLEIPGMLIFNSGRGTWLSVAGAWLLDVLLAIVYAYMGIRFNGESMVQYSVTILGKYVGRVVGIIFPIFFIISASIVMRFLVALTTRLFLPDTPMDVLFVVSYILIAYGVHKGVETLARMCEFLGPIFLLSQLVLGALLVPKVKIHRLKPVFDQGIYPILTGIPFILSFIGICIIMGMYIPICNHPNKGFIGKFIAVSMGASMIGLLVFTSTGIFGAEQAGNMVNPAFQLARLASLGNFFQRAEIILLIVVTAAGLMTTANLIWAFSTGISQIVGLSSYKPLVYPAVLLAFVLNLTSFRSNIDEFNFAYYAFFLLGILVETGLEMFLFFAALILKKRGKKTTF